MIPRVGLRDAPLSTAVLLAVDWMDDTLAAMRGLLDAGLTLPAIRAFNQQTEWVPAKVAGAAPCAVCLCAGTLRWKLSRIWLPLQALAAGCAETDLALNNDLFAAIDPLAAGRRPGLLGGPG